MNREDNMIKNFRVGYYNVRESVTSTLYQKDSAVQLAEQLQKVAPTHKDAKYFVHLAQWDLVCLLYTSPSPRDRTRSRMPSSA